MEKTKLSWEDVIKFEEVKGYGEHIWKNYDQYYYVTEEGGIAVQRVVYELPKDLFELLERNEKSMADIHFKLRYDSWPPKVTQLEADKNFLRDNPELLNNDVANQKLFTRKELEEILPAGSEILASSDS
ncbi:TPA: hypothetical protein U1C21_001992 [Streptococcus suis]|uniref:hypothetical protein n=1 Tax=Streptococcus sp. A18 TaxID=3373125 RepID=UPI002AA36304|nr:hypothetical protein [Streptococcus suis]HEM3638788.1 hypothetical protein [Streptococcus suis]